MRGGGSKADQARRPPGWVDPEVADTAASEGEAGGQPAWAAASLGLPRNHPRPHHLGAAGERTAPARGLHASAHQAGRVLALTGLLPETSGPSPACPRPSLFPSGVCSSALYKTESRHWCHLVCGFQDPPRDPTHTEQRRSPAPVPRAGRTRRKPGALLCPGAGCAGHLLAPGEVRASTASQPAG